MKKYILEIEKDLSSYPKRTSSQNPEAYIGGGQSRLRYLGLRVPHLQQTLKKGFSFSLRNKEEQSKIWNFIWLKSDCYEVMSLALAWFYDPRQKEILLENWPLLKNWAFRIDNWAHSDTLSAIFARILETNPQLVYPTMRQWNTSKNPWLRRLSIVSLIYFSSQREKVLPLEKILRLVEPQLIFEHYYVQKAVGWTLRECFNVYPQKTFEFIKTNIHQISPQAFSTSIEKMNSQQKNVLKRLRHPKRKIKIIKK